MIRPLEPPDSFHLQAAQAWLELGNHVEAHEELEQLAPHLCGHRDVLQVRWLIYAAAKKWEACVQVGQRLVEMEPDDSFGWLCRAYALRWTSAGLQGAFDALRPAAERIENVDEIQFNLACYACQLGKLDEARAWLSQAFEVAQRRDRREHVRQKALDDQDLEPLWKEIGKL